MKIGVVEGSTVIPPLVVSPQIVEIGETVTFTSSTNVGGYQVTNYEFHFGDGATLTTTQNEVTHAYSDDDTFDPRLRVMVSGVTFSSLFFSSFSTSSKGAKGSISTRFSVVLPTWQYKQSYEQILTGIKSTPRESPNRLDGTGPNI